MNWSSKTYLYSIIPTNDSINISTHNNEIYVIQIGNHLLAYYKTMFKKPIIKLSG